MANANLVGFTTADLLAELDRRHPSTNSPNPSPLPPFSSSRSRIGVPVIRPRVPLLDLALAGATCGRHNGAPQAAAATCARHYGETEDEWCESHGVSICKMCRHDHPTCKTYCLASWLSVNGPAMEIGLTAVRSRISAVEVSLHSPSRLTPSRLILASVRISAPPPRPPVVLPVVPRPRPPRPRRPDTHA